MKVVEPKWSRQQLEGIVHALARDSEKVIFTDHFLQRLDERGVTAGEALRCLQRGVIIAGPDWSAKHKNYEFRIREPWPRDIVCVVASVKPVSNPDEVVAVTVWEVGNV